MNQKNTVRKLKIFDQNYELNPLLKMQILQLSNINFFLVLKSSFTIKNIANSTFWSIWARKVKVKKLQIFDQNHGLTPSQNMQIFQLPTYQLICSLEKDFCVKNVYKHSFWTIWTRKKETRKLQIFDQNYGLTLCKNANFASL